MTDATRRASERLGRRAETLAAWWLRLKGYRILANRYKGLGGEIDLIARRGGTIVFVEVKARSTLEEALNAVTPAQRERIAASAAGFLAAHPAHGNCDARFDVIAIRPGKFPVHAVDAWRT
jgi:putative endonuclease